MKWLKKLFGNRETNYEKPVLRFGEVTVRPNTDDEEEIRQLNSQATQLQSEGEMDEAIECLKKARDLMPTVAVDYPIAQYLRLPLYQQKAGYLDDAIASCDHLLETKYHSFDTAAIYDKLRLMHQREKLFLESIEYGVMNLAWVCIAYKEQDRDYSDYQEADIWVDKITSPLKKLKQLPLADLIAAECVNFAEEPDEINIYELMDKVKNILRQGGN